MEKYGLSLKKGYGQNFLINGAVPRRIAAESYGLACAHGEGPHGVLEIGPGAGALTQALCRTYDKVVAVELDPGLIPLLSEALADAENLTIVNADFMALDLPQFLDERFGELIAGGGTVSVCANLPYYITTPVLMKLLESFPMSRPIPFAAITVMVQLEVARRLTAKAGATDYGAISVAIALRAEAAKLFDVAAGNFLPAPKVASAVAALVPHGGIREICEREGIVLPEMERAPVLSSPEEEPFESFARETAALVRMAFGKRRKTLLNAAAERYEKSAMLAALERCGIRPDVRGETLSAAQFCAIAASLRENRENAVE